MIRGALTALVPVLVVLAYATAVGSALRLLLRRWTVIPRGLGVTAGLGLSMTAVVVCGGYLLDLPATAPVLPLAAASVATVVVVLVRAATRARRTEDGWRVVIAPLLPVPADAIAVVAAFIALGPVLRLGLTYWTSFVNDFPNYVASTEVWLAADGEGPTFAERHPDDFGAHQVWRAGAEKPMMTALLVAVTRITGLPVWSLLTPIMLVALIIGVSALATAVAAAMPRMARAGVLVVLVPTFSVVPMSRVFDAQLGHVVAVALAAVALVVVGCSTPSDARFARWAHAAVGGLVVTACVGANPSLVLGTCVTLVAALAWLTARRGVAMRTFAAGGLRTALAAAVLSAPLVGWYVDALRRQTDGEPGFAIPLASPLALVGLQPSLVDAGSTHEVSLQWAALLVVGAGGYAAYRARHSGPPATGLLVLSAAANGAVIIGRVGSINYATHKWLTVVVALVVPLVLARLLDIVPPVADRAGWLARSDWFAVGAGGLTVVSAVVCWGAAGAVRNVVTDDLLALAGDPRVTARDAVNVRLSSVYENSMAPLVIGAPRVVNMGLTYGEPACPEGDWLLTHADALTGWSYDDVLALGGDLVLADIDLELGPGTVTFGTDTPWTAGHLCGRWHPTEDGGTWSDGASASVVLDPVGELASGDIVATIEGRRFSVDGGSSAVVVTTGGEELGRAELVGEHAARITVTVPAEAVRDGRLVLTVHAPDPVVPADVGGTDTRALGFMLTALTLEPSR